MTNWFLHFFGSTVLSWSWVGDNDLNLRTPLPISMTCSIKYTSKYCNKCKWPLMMTMIMNYKLLNCIPLQFFKFMFCRYFVIFNLSIRNTSYNLFLILIHLWVELVSLRTIEFCYLISVELIRIRQDSFYFA